MSRERPNSIRLVLPDAAPAEQVPGSPPADGSSLHELASIVVPCIGQLEYTRLCVPSLLRHTRPPFELVFVDVGTLDGTSEYLAGVNAAAAVPIEVIASP